MVWECKLKFVRTERLDVGTTLWGTGVHNILSGILFELPIPVQPMKSIAATAVSEDLPLDQILVAGILTGAMVLFLGVTGMCA